MSMSSSSFALRTANLQVTLDDELRVSIAGVLKDRIEKSLSSGRQGSLYQPNIVLAEDILDHLSMLA